MIIFDLDGTLADCEHRRHFVEEPPHSIINPEFIKDLWVSPVKTNPKWREFIADWESFYEACDKDQPIWPVIQIYEELTIRKYQIQIWSGRCESVRYKTEKWLDYHHIEYTRLKMRPIGDNTTAHELKERWLEKYFHSGQGSCSLRWATHDKCCKKIDFVFEDDPKCIEMYRRRGIFVFDCKQNMEVQ